jgi:hypothetical protein
MVGVQRNVAHGELRRAALKRKRKQKRHAQPARAVMVVKHAGERC